MDLPPALVPPIRIPTPAAREMIMPRIPKEALAVNAAITPTIAPGREQRKMPRGRSRATAAMDAGAPWGRLKGWSIEGTGKMK